MDDDSSIVLNTKWSAFPAGTSDSGESSFDHRPSKRVRRNDHGGSLPRFKGVVPQQNGHWGAQIYANHHRIWLGTFKSEKEAAMAYDSAAIKLRCGGNTHRNFPRTDLNVQEPAFQSLYSDEDVQNMIRDGSYQAKLEDFVKILSNKEGRSTVNLSKKLVHGDTQFSCTQLFQKELTPSDVGKLNRLVIPKKHAVKHFPQIRETDQQRLAGGAVEDAELVFYDKLMKTWRFRYCYWRSSQSFVFTRGWSRFVKEKKLSEKDAVTFYACEECPGWDQNSRNFFLIDVNYNGRKDTSADDDVRKDNLELELNLGKKSYCSISGEDETVEKRSVTLFGVQIN
ncbi:AP2/ERF and B3 domain-containing transcription factor [Hibiscus syriacus]|uniref:AP2/ERF and B3 domain-containing transcription factor n=1 Tax=Hibiscus syriacus TaxID=106335 RepID=A0A6A2YK41_HIBSY|nr:AP2/ERF and B3 domain-containing transcription factor At1g51120-like [Hibiscus syriacus]KAE8677204.1 AP2/ERF and B3 domain-containing transcription factor [Hibiscus syriacus]